MICDLRSPNTFDTCLGERASADVHPWASKLFIFKLYLLELAESLAVLSQNRFPQLLFICVVKKIPDNIHAVTRQVLVLF